jgi:trehalose 6-phosphate phosphatase
MLRALVAGDPIERLASDPEAAALFLDVDGALAPIVEDPDDSSVPEATRVELRRLAARYGLVACVTGRPSARARAIVGVPELRYAGEHGLELEPEAEEWAGRLRAFVGSAGWPAEQEKRLTASFHYRTHPEPERARAELEEVAAAAQAEGFRTRWGRMVLEVVPPIDASKGTAVRRLLDETGLRRALYAGDDTTDLDGFAALDGLEVAVRVAVASAEGPPELVARADIVVASTGEFLDLLRLL